MNIARRQSYRMIFILVMVTWVLTGCASVFRNIDDKIHRKRFESAYKAYGKALAVYDEGDFDRALAQFKALSAQGTSGKIARKAWLGEICCLLMMADTQTQYTSAIGMWHDYVRSALERDANYDLALLDPLIVRMTPKSTTQVVYIRPPAALPPVEPPAIEQSSGEQKPAEATAPADRQPVDRQLQAEIADLKKKVERAAQQQRQMDAVVAENRSLKEKIKALEAIDQNIQKKKTEIAAPSE